jgi:7-carboxy-7-deazaguanine synthase
VQTTEDAVPISEIFYSIQGEGTNAGTPSVFLRTYRCNLSCKWCDTKYTWLGQEKSTAGVDYRLMSTASALAEIEKFGCKHVVVTGGEPLLHQRALEPLLAELKRNGFFVEMETNGTIAPSREAIEKVDCFNVSPKIANSGIEERVRVRPEALSAFVRSGKAWFKFVICHVEDIAEVESILTDFGIQRERVMLMPEGLDAPTIIARGMWLVEECKRRGFRFSPRLHILLYGNKRGI